MNAKKFLPFVVIGALVMVFAFGAVTYHNVFAQASTPTPSTPQQTTPPNQPGKGFRGEFREGAGYTQQDLANALNITVDQLQTAQQAATTEALHQAVSQGLITQAQADQLSSKGFMLPHFGMEGFLQANGIDYNALLAGALNIDAAQLQAAYQQAYFANLDAAVQNGNLTQDQADLAKARYALQNDANFKSALQSAYQNALQQAVQNGVITQNQADLLLQQQNNNHKQQGFPGFFGGPGGFGGRRGHGFGRGGMWGNGTPMNPAAPNTTPPSTAPSGDV